MAFNAKQFRDIIGSQRPASANFFTVKMELPKIFSDNTYAQLANKVSLSPVIWANIFKNIEFRCEITQMPGRAVTTIRRESNSGPGRDIPTGLVYNTLQLSFIEHPDYSIRHVMDVWQELMYTHHAGGKYRVLYYDDLITKLEITAYDSKGIRVKTYIVQDAFPVSIQPQSLAWSMNNQYVSTAIEFSYHQWQTHNSAVGSVVLDKTSYVPSNAAGQLAPTSLNNLQDKLNVTKLSNIESKLNSAGLQDITNAAKQIAQQDPTGFSSGLIANSQALVDNARGIALEANQTLEEYVGKALTALATGQDAVNAIKQQAQIDARSILGNTSAAGQDVVNKGLQTIAENVPFGDILKPTAQASVDRAVNKAKEKALNKLNSFF